MRRTSHFLGLAVLLACAATPCLGQQPIQWKQTINLPKGLNLPKGVTADILGIELGDSYAEAKAKLERLAAEAPPARQAPRSPMQLALDRGAGVSDAKPPLEEQTDTIRLRLPNGDSIQAAYVGKIVLNRELPGSGAGKIRELLTVQFSAPSSAQQVMGMERTLSYSEQIDQPRLSELLAKLKEKFQAEPQQHGNEYRFQFNDGRAFVPPNANVGTCRAQYVTSQQKDVPFINRTGDCDVVLNVKVHQGISPDHIVYVVFSLSDNERAKANLAADFAFFETYLKERQQQSGAAPKL